MQSFRPKGWELNGAISSVGRALDCGSRCRGFEPHIAPQDGRNAVFFCFTANGPCRSQQSSPWTGTKNTRRYCWLAGLPPIHLGSQCATERVYRYLPAKVELKKSHFGKQSFIECALRYPPCQSEFNKNVSMASRPVDHGFCRMKSISTPFHPVKCGFVRMGTANR